MTLTCRRALLLALTLAVLVVPGTTRPLLAAQSGVPTELQGNRQTAAGPDEHALHPLHEIYDALVRLPLAAALGAALALRSQRPRRPPGSLPVGQTQIVLSVVGAIVMLVVGASLARAFGIVGAANLVRYRSKI